MRLGLLFQSRSGARRMGISEIPTFQTSERCELITKKKRWRESKAFDECVGGEGERSLERIVEKKAGQRGGISFPSLPPPCPTSHICLPLLSVLLVRCQKGGYAGKFCVAGRGNDHDLGSCPLLLSPSYFLPVAENSPVPRTYLSTEQRPAQLRGQWDRSERP